MGSLLLLAASLLAVTGQSINAQENFLSNEVRSPLLHQIENHEVDSGFPAKGHQVKVKEEMLEKFVREFLGRLGQEPRYGLIPTAGEKLVEITSTPKAITELCGTSSSLTCARKIEFLNIAEDDDAANVDDTWERCQARKEFLDCIEPERRKCKNLAETGYYPLLPSKSEIKIIQENAWKRLWTSGACVLQA